MNMFDDLMDLHRKDFQMILRYTKPVPIVKSILMKEFENFMKRMEEQRYVILDIRPCTYDYEDEQRAWDESDDHDSDSDSDVDSDSDEGDIITSSSEHDSNSYNDSDN